MNLRIWDWRHHSLAIHVLLAVLASITVVLGGWTALTIIQLQSRLGSELVAQGETQIAILASASGRYVAERDSGQLILIAAATTSNNIVQYIAFYDTGGATLASTAAPSAATTVRTPFNDLRAQVQSSRAHAVQWTDSYLDVAAPLSWANTPQGVIAIRLDASPLVAARRAVVINGVLSGLALISVLGLTVGLLMRQLVIRPLHRMTSATDQISQGVWVMPVDQDRHDEFGRMARSFAQMIDTLRSREADLQAYVRTVDELNTSLDQKVVQRTAELHELVTNQDLLLRQIHQMSIPVVPVLKGVLVIPLIGSLDSTRTQQLMDNIMTGIENYRAHLVILDITGVPVVDTQIAHVFQQVAQTTALLGAKAILVGIRPEVAQTMVQLGIHLEAIHTFATLQEAVHNALMQPSLNDRMFSLA